MSSSALSSQGMEVRFEDLVVSTSPPTMRKIPDVISVDGPGGQSNEVDVTDLSSVAKEFILGLQDEGDITLEVNYRVNNVRHQNLRTLRQTGAINLFYIVFTDSPVTTWSFNAYVKGLTVSNAVDGVTRGTFTLRVSGPITEI